MIEHLNIKVTGKVQGVFFRASTKDKALDLEIFGWVRNEPDGSVYIEAEGEKDKLNEFVQWCHSGPDHAKVDEVKVDKHEITKGFKTFEVKRH